MKMRELFKRSDTLSGLIRDLKSVDRLVRGRASAGTIRDYVSANPIRKLQLGAGESALPGWLTTDIARSCKGVVYLDVGAPFPIEDDTFDYVYSEHLVEHMTRADGLRMLGECRRILKPGGVVRTATPDLEVLIRLYDHHENGRAEEYIRWVTDRYIDGVTDYRAAHVINNAFRNWGHQFLYDGDLMNATLHEAGFTEITRCTPGESAHVELQGVERHGRHVVNEDMNAFETMVFEGIRPQ